MYKLLLLIALSCLTFFAYAQERTFTVSSPNEAIKLSVVSQDSKIYYVVSYKNNQTVYPSVLGMDVKTIKGRETISSIDFSSNLEIFNSNKVSIRDQWKPVLGEKKYYKNRYNGLTLNVRKKEEGKTYYINIYFRVFDDAIGFRYEIPKQQYLNNFVVTKEHSQFALKQNYTAWWQAGSYNTNEYTLHETRLSEIDAAEECASNTLFYPLGCDANLVQTPIMLKSPKGKIYANIHEASLVNFPAMQLMLDKSTNTFTADLVSDAFGNKAYLQAPAKTPWRVMLMSDKAEDIIASHTILNLNEPSKIKNTDWIKPVKYIGVWWEMFCGKGTWDYLGTQNSAQDAKPAGTHSANSDNVKRYIDFASEHGFDGVLVEGWNTGWEDWFGQWKEPVFDFVTPYPDFDLKGLQRYAKSKNVYLIMHHETSGSATNYERQLDTAYKFMNRFGYPAVKTGYVGPIIPRGENHDGQWMVNHYIRVAKKAAQHKVMIDVHEPVRPTGQSRTYPNWLASEAARGMEYNAWGNGNAIDHDLNLIFTRFIGGPMDYTPGIFRLKLDYFPGKKEVVHSTLARQLALYVVMYSPLQMAADLPENYAAKLDAFQFIKDVPTDWDDTKILEAEPGEYITTARKGKNTDNWFLGSITDEKARKTTIKLDFLDKGKAYEATIYEDVVGKTVVDISPDIYNIKKVTVKKNDKLKLALVGAGGVAVSITPIL